MLILLRLSILVLIAAITSKVCGVHDLRSTAALDCPRALAAPLPSRPPGGNWSLLQLSWAKAHLSPLEKRLLSTPLNGDAERTEEPHLAESAAPMHVDSPQSPRPALVEVEHEVQEVSQKSTGAPDAADASERWVGIEWLMWHLREAAQAARLSSFALQVEHASLPVEFPLYIELPLIGVISFCAMLVMTVTGFDQQIVFQWGWFMASIFGLASGRFTESVSIISIWPLPLQMQKAWEVRRSLNRTLGLTWGFIASVVSVPGVMILVRHDNAHLKTAFGVLLLSVFAWEACVEWRLTHKQPVAPLKFEMTARRLPLVLCTGIIAGALSGLFATPGPAFTMFVLLIKIGKEEFRSTQTFVMAVFLAPVRILALAGFGLNITALKWHYLAGFIGGLVGLVLGDSLAKHGSHTHWRCVALLLQFLFGVTFVCAPLLPSSP